MVIPVVGDLSGPSAIAGIGRLLAFRRVRLSVFYVSNMEFYLFGEGAFARYVANLGRVAHMDNSVIIRSVFGGFAGGFRPGDASVSRVQPIDDLLNAVAAGKIRYCRRSRRTLTIPKALRIEAGARCRVDVHTSLRGG